MQNLNFCLSTLIILVCAAYVSAGYGDEVSGTPTYFERAVHAVTNIVRMDQTPYRTSYKTIYAPEYPKMNVNTVLATSQYPVTGPLYHDANLDHSSRSHSVDMATNNCFSHNNCNGTDPFVRIKSFYTCSAYLGENIAAGQTSPRDVVNAWMCDSADGGVTCCADRTACDGHRTNTMNTWYSALGNGYAYSASSTYKNYWSQDFGGAPCTGVKPAIAVGSHIINGNTIKFITTFYSAGVPKTASVVINDQQYPLTLDVGVAGKGNYYLQQTLGSGCREYYFYFVDVNGLAQFYPETGTLKTTNEGSCQLTWRAGRNQLPTTASATTAAVMTTAVRATTATPATTAVRLTTASVPTTATPATTAVAPTTAVRLTTASVPTTAAVSATTAPGATTALKLPWVKGSEPSGSNTDEQPSSTSGFSDITTTGVPANSPDQVEMNSSMKLEMTSVLFLVVVAVIMML